jgi:hypothetical protein
VTIPLVVHDHFFEIIASAPGHGSETVSGRVYVRSLRR